MADRRSHGNGSPPLRHAEAGAHRYNVGTDTLKLWATTVILPVRSCGAEIQGSSTSSAKGLLPRSRQIARTVPSGSPVPYANLPRSYSGVLVQRNDRDGKDVLPA